VKIGMALCMIAMIKLES